MRTPFLYAWIRGLGVMLILGGCSLPGVPVSDLVGDAVQSVPSDSSASELSAVESAVQVEPPPGTIIKWGDGGTLVYIPAGEFIMGGEGEDNPGHTVMLDGFWIHQAEVTNGMYADCAAEGFCTTPANEPPYPSDYTNPELEDRPAVGVDWEQAQTYCGWVDGRLPTEAQWEKTARGPDGNIHPWGDTEPTCDLLNFEDCVGRSTDVDIYPQGQSYYHALDMAGNVFEWAADWYAEGYFAVAPLDNPMGPEAGQTRSVRGSSYQSAADKAASALRLYLEPEKYRQDLGFRCVISGMLEMEPFCELSFSLLTPEMPPPPYCIGPKLQPIENQCIQGLGYYYFNLGLCSSLQSISSSNVNCSTTSPNVIACWGPYGATDTVEVCCDCGLPPSHWSCDDVLCPPDYAMDFSDCSCVYTGGGTQGNCPPGYLFDPGAQCCVPEEIQAPCGGSYDPITHDCEQPNYRIACVQETFTLPDCTPPEKECEDPEQYGDKASCENAGCNWKCSGAAALSCGCE